MDKEERKGIAEVPEYIEDKGMDADPKNSVGIPQEPATEVNKGMLSAIEKMHIVNKWNKGERLSEEEMSQILDSAKSDQEPNGILQKDPGNEPPIYKDGEGEQNGPAFMTELPEGSHHVQIEQKDGTIHNYYTEPDHPNLLKAHNDWLELVNGFSEELSPELLALKEQMGNDLDAFMNWLTGFYNEQVEGGSDSPEPYSEPAGEVLDFPPIADTLVGTSAAGHQSDNPGELHHSLNVDENAEPALHPDGRTKRRPGRQPGNTAIMNEQRKLAVLNDYMNGQHPLAIAKKYDISVQYVYWILNKDPKIAKVKKSMTDAQSTLLASSMRENQEQVQSMISRYLELANDSSRINATTLPSLFTILGITVDKMLKIEEVELKRKELELKREEMEKANQNSGTLLGELAQLLSAANTLPTPDPSDDGSEEVAN